MIRLAPVRTQLKLRLTEGSLAGAYQVSLVDEFDRSLAAPALNRSGKALIVTLDLRPAAPGSFRLQIQHSNETPDFYPLHIEASR